MKGFLRLVIGLPILACGVLIGLYGLLGLLWRDHGPGGGNTYVTLFGHEMGAHLVGGIALFVSLALIFVSLWFMRTRNARCGKSA
jgi:hypothetical protein